MSKYKINLNIPVQIGYYILQYPTLRMLFFYYDAILRYIERQLFEYMEMDTDSAYFAIAGNSLEDVIKQSKTTGISRTPGEAKVFFPRTCCPTYKRYDKRSPGLFKLEAEGHDMVARCLNTYLLHQRHRPIQDVM